VRYVVCLFACTFLLMVLAGCNALGGIPPETVGAVSNSGGGCVAVESLVMGKAVVMVGSADKGTLRNGEVTVAAGCGGITIKNATIPPVPAPAPVPAVAPLKP
jgi:hypothetical protein